jgi:hypothetical protein
MLKKTAQRYWCGDPPRSCQVCDQPIKDVFVDGMTQWGPWGFMCPTCHALHGEGIGTGKGQMYQRQADDRWLKIEPEMEHPVDREPPVNTFPAELADVKADPFVMRLLDQIANDDFIDNPLK